MCALILGLTIAPCVSDCGVDDFDKPNITSTESLSCILSESCVDIQCCLYVNELASSFVIDFSIQECDLVLEISIEKQTFTIPLKDALNGMSLVV